jgi:tetratricopeptide (TPR) repeat protein
MLNHVKVIHKPHAWLTTCILRGICVLLLWPMLTKAQDRIQKTDKSVIEARVLEISSADIKYKKFSNPGGPTYIIPKAEVTAIVYENGEKEVFSQPAPVQATVPVPPGMGEAASREKARYYVLTGNINEAIATYTRLLANDRTNSSLLAEDAYALALAGIYDAALMRLDMSWSAGSNSTDTRYFSAQVFALMGYDDLAREFWKPTDKYVAPAWISAKAGSLLQKYGSKKPLSTIKNREQLIANFKKANELAAQNAYFQSIALFQDITNIYPAEYLPYVGYSISLEKTGAFAKSAQSIEKAISLIGNTPEEKTRKQLLEKRLTTMKLYMTSPPPLAPPTIQQSNMKEPEKLQMMAYAGGVVSSQLTNLNGRIGYFVTGSINAALDFGLIKTPETSSTSLGLSAYNRSKNFVSGAGIMMYSGNSTTTFAVKFTLGFSKMNRARTSSFDIFFDVNKALQQEGLTTFAFSVGKSFYFGKRK